MSCGLDEPSISGSPALTIVALVHADMLALGDQVLARLADFRRDHDLALALGVLAEGNLAVDFAR